MSQKIMMGVIVLELLNVLVSVLKNGADWLGLLFSFSVVVLACLNMVFLDGRGKR